MNSKSNPYVYDVFKLVVAIVLLIIFVLLLLRVENKPSNAVAVVTQQVPVSTEVAAKDTPTLAVELKPSLLPALPPFPQSSIPLRYEATDNSLKNENGDSTYILDEKTNTWKPVLPKEMISELPQGAEVKEKDGGWYVLAADGSPLYAWDMKQLTWSAISPPTPMPSPTAIPTSAIVEDTPATQPENIATPTQSISLDGGVCPMPLPSRLAVGLKARVRTGLYLRSAAEIGKNIISTNPAQSIVEVVGGPVCTPHEEGAYLWWQVKTKSSATGWSAEGSLDGKTYFLEPLQ